MAILYYIHDPMCSWCWGFRPVWQNIKKQLSAGVQIEYILGGLAPDSDDPMPEETQHYIKMNWKRIQQVIPGIEFNYTFWEKNQPRRSSYPACRAVIAAKNQGKTFESKMIFAIQNAYYLHALNPSDDAVLIQLANNIGLNLKQFKQQLNHQSTQDQLISNINHYQQLAWASGAQGFPSLVFNYKDKSLEVPRDYHHASTAVNFIEKQLDL